MKKKHFLKRLDKAVDRMITHKNRMTYTKRFSYASLTLVLFLFGFCVTNVFSEDRTEKERVRIERAQTELKLLNKKLKEFTQALSFADNKTSAHAQRMTQG